MRGLVFLVSFVLVCSCAVNKTGEDVPLKLVCIQGFVQHPYCGGAIPSPEMAGGRRIPMSNESYSIVRGTSYIRRMPIYRSIVFDKEGLVNVQLEEGNYMLIKTEKLLPFAEFKKRNSMLFTNYYSFKGDDCFENWATTADFSFRVKDQSVIVFEQTATCWTNRNPCLEYNGPLAP
jgi:hypothetical protein